LRLTTCFLNGNKGNKIIASEHLVHHRPHPVHVLIADLHEDRAAVGQQVEGDGQPIAQIGQVGVDAVLPGVSERLDLLGLAADVSDARRFAGATSSVSRWPTSPAPLTDAGAISVSVGTPLLAFL
jgi:hypothetical protein